MSDRLKQIVDTAPRVVSCLATSGYWRPAGTAKDLTEGVVVAKADFHWMVENLQRDLEVRATQHNSILWAENRVKELEEAIQPVLEANEPLNPDELTKALRNLRSVWTRA